MTDAAKTGGGSGTIDSANGTAAPDRPLPGDWPFARLLWCSVLGHLLILGCAVRHRWFWGDPYASWFHALEAVVLFAGVALTAPAYARAVRQATSLPRARLLQLGALLTVLAWLAPPFLSTDVFDYCSRGRVEVLGGNPYVQTVDDFRDDPGLGDYAQGSDWTHFRNPYGPIASLVQRLCAMLPNVLAAVYAFKLLMALCHVGIALLLERALQQNGDERQSRRGLALWLLNPWILVECAGSGHNDALMVLFLVAGLVALQAGHIALGTMRYGLAMLTKHSCAPLAPLLLAEAVHRGRLRNVLVGLPVLVGLGAIAGLHYFREPQALESLRAQASVRFASSQWLASAVSDWLPNGIAVAALAAILAICVIAWRRCTSLANTLGFGVLVMAIAIAFGVPNFSPWYQIWWLPLFAFVPAAVLPRCLELLAWTGLLAYLPFVATREMGAPHQLTQFVLACAWPILLVLLEWRSLLPSRSRPVRQLPDEPD